jgi:hypothetical protein
MTWIIGPTITINGTAYLSNAVGAVSIDYGRTTVWEPQRASYATIKLINTNNTSFGIDINNSVVVKVRNATNTADITVFTGVVTTVANEVGINTGAIIISYVSITAVGPITVLGRTQSGLVDYPSENESARISRILAETSVSLDTIDTGTYTLLDRLANPTDALSLLNAYANTATGSIYETTSGKVGYASELRRNQDVAANGYFSINPTFINGSNLKSQTNQGDVVNNVKVGYNNGSYVTVISTASVATYGTIGATLDTSINNELDATTLAGIYIGMRAYPKVSLSAVEVRIDDADMDATTLDKMLNIYFGMPVSLAGLPLTITPTTYQGFVEGWNLSFSQLSAKITLRTTEKTYSYRSTQWEDVDPALIWSSVNAALTWNTYD